MKKLIFSLILLFLSRSTISRAEDTSWRTYSLKRLPVSEKSCTETALELGEKFEKTVHPSVYRAICERADVEGYDVLISYSQTSVRFVSTIEESDQFGAKGIYSTLSQCQQALPSEVKTFTEATGLVPFISYCFKESSLNRTPFAARIDAWGDAKMYPYRFEKLIFADTIERRQEVLSSILSAAKSGGIQAHQAAFANDGSSKLVVRFYGIPTETAHHFNYFLANEVARYPSWPSSGTPLEICRSQMKEAAEGFSSTYSTPGIWFCAWDSLLFNAKLYLVRIRPEEWIKTDTLPDRYSTFNECQKQIPGIRTWYEKKLAITPFAILCSWKSGLGFGKPEGFAMKVLSKTSEMELPFGPDPDWGRKR